MNQQDLLAKVRKNMEGQSKKQDENEFRIRSPKSEVSYKFVILPPSPPAGFWYYHGATHWLKGDNNKKTPYECPRIHDTNVKCPLCDAAFGMMEGRTKAERSKIAELWLPKEWYGVNIYFMPSEDNPEELRGTVKYYRMPRTVWQIVEKCFRADGPGSDPDDPQPFGLFYPMPFDGRGEPSEVDIKSFTESYIFKLKAGPDAYGFTKYTGSDFLAKTKGFMFTKKVNGQDVPDIDRFKQILALRHDIKSKVQPRNMVALAEIANKLRSTLDPTSSSIVAPDSGVEDDEPMAPQSVSPQPKQDVSAYGIPTPTPTVQEPASAPTAVKPENDKEKVNALIAKLKAGR